MITDSFDVKTWIGVPACVVVKLPLSLQFIFGGKMIVSKEYERLMLYYELPERFRAGDFGLLEEEIATLRDFVDGFYASVEDNGCVTLEDFTEFMDFLAVIRDADSDAVQNIIAEVFMKSAEIRNRLSKQ